MNAKDRLAIWLGNKKRDYKEGLSIYKDLAVNPKRNSFLDTPVPGGVQINMMFNDLVRYARIHKIQPKSAEQAALELNETKSSFKNIVTQKQPVQTQTDQFIEKSRVHIFTNPIVDYNKLPGELKSVYDKFHELYAQYDSKRIELVELAELPDKNVERRLLAETIVELKKTIRTNWDKIDDWWKANNGEAPKAEQPKTASGKMSKAEIEKIEDPEIKVLSKKMRIDANLKYISRNHATDVQKVKEKLLLRTKELDEWEVDYAELLKKD